MQSFASPSPGATVGGSVLSWKTGSLGAYLTGVSGPTTTGKSSVTCVSDSKADVAARTSELIAKINAVKATMPRSRTQLLQMFRLKLRTCRRPTRSWSSITDVCSVRWVSGAFAVTRIELRGC